MRKLNLKIFLACLLFVSGFSMFAHASTWTPTTQDSPPLKCSNGQVVAGTSLFNATTAPNGACAYTGLNHIFSTIMCQFVTMLNIIYGVMFCSIQKAFHHIVVLGSIIYVIVIGAQLLMGTLQMNTRDLVSRMLKLAFVIWLASDPEQTNFPSLIGTSISGTIEFLFQFFIAFIMDSTRWVVKVLTSNMAVVNTGTGACDVRNPNNWAWTIITNNPGVIATFYFLDNCVYAILAGNLTAASQKVTMFFVAMAFAMPAIFMLAVYFVVSASMMLIRTLFGFLVAVTAIAFLLSMAPIFLCFMLFQTTFSFFDTWVRFMISFSLQVMITFAILAMWLFSLTLFAPFFNELAEVIFPYQKVWRTAAPIYDPAVTWGICDPIVQYNYGNAPTLQCKSEKRFIPPAKINELPHFIFYIFYHMFTLIIVSFGFSQLQKHGQKIAKDLAGPQFAPILNSPGVGTNSFGELKKGSGEVNKFMSKQLFGGFNRRHGAAAGPQEQIERHGGGAFMSQLSNLLGGR